MAGTAAAGASTGGPGGAGGNAGVRQAGGNAVANQAGGNAGARQAGGNAVADQAGGNAGGGDAAAEGATAAADGSADGAPDQSAGGGRACAKGTSNLFVELLGKTQAEVDEKVTTAIDRYFGIGTNESATPVANTGYRCYYELLNDSTMGYIWAADSNDIRSEGMSYGMMLAAQMGFQTQFDHLWNFAKKYMQITSAGPLKNFFNWKGTVNGSTVAFNNSNPAPDGDQYFAAALYVADRRWGSGGSIDYKQEADTIVNSFMHNTGSGTNCTIFNNTQHQVVFFPYGNSCNFTDPSYHLPAFYELFALYGPPADSGAWKTQAEASRAFFAKSAHASTGLHPDYAAFSGSPTTSTSGDGHDKFQYDAWRVVMNMAVDYAWFSSDAAMKAQVEKYHAFFANYLGTDNVTQSLFSVDGSGGSGGGSTALTSTLAAGALASGAANKSTYVTNLWGVAQQSGQYRYYQESVYLLGLLASSGKYCYAF